MITLKEDVRQIIDNQLEDNYTLEQFAKDLNYGGCQSGLVSELIYYADTTAFFDRHYKEIGPLLDNIINSYGFACPAELFGDKWDTSDSIAVDTNNKNLLAWFAFEETAREIFAEEEVEV